MKTWHLRRGRNMFRISFDWNMLENVKGWLSVYVYVYADSSLRTKSMYAARVHAYAARLHAYVGMFMRTHIYSWLHIYAGYNYVRIHSACVCSHGPVCVCHQIETLFWIFWIPFSSIPHPIANLTFFFIIFTSNYKPNIIFHLIENLTLFFLFSL